VTLLTFDPAVRSIDGRDALGVRGHVDAQVIPDVVRGSIFTEPLRIRVSTCVVSNPMESELRLEPVSVFDSTERAPVGGRTA
jgi:hypothetical protein